MNDFLIENYFSLTYFIEFLAAVTGIILYKQFKVTTAKYFIIFLNFIAIVDFVCLYSHFVRVDRFLDFLIGSIFEKNHWVFTITWDIGAVVFFSFYYWKILKFRIFRDLTFLLGVGFLIFSIIQIWFHLDIFFTQFYFFIEIAGGVVIILCTSFYFVEILQSEEVLKFHKSIDFYITVAIFIWWLIITPLTFYDVYYVYEVGSPHRDIEYFKLRKTIYLLANLFMYGTFTFALIYCRPEKKETLDCK